MTTSNCGAACGNCQEIGSVMKHVNSAQQAGQVLYSRFSFFLHSSLLIRRFIHFILIFLNSFLTNKMPLEASRVLPTKDLVLGFSERKIALTLGRRNYL